MNILGIDIGGTNTKIGIVTEAGKVFDHQVIPTQADRPLEDFLQRLYTTLDSFENDFEAVGIGMPNLNPKTGAIQGSVNLSWSDQPLRDKLKEYFKNKEIRLENDANIAAVGEKVFGAAKDSRDFIVITLGTGLGTGVFTDGHIVHGSNGLAGEGGHLTILPNGRSCPCSGIGHLEAYVSVRGIQITCREITGRELEFRAIKELYDQDDKEILEVIERTADYLALGLSQMQTLLAPEKFILAGGVSSLGNSFCERVSRHLEKYSFKPLSGSATVELSQMPSDHGAILGAAAQFFIKS